ncbi:protein PYRICULARIA ORYZAE RESISTANCE 21-like isoform X3 [Macadamia integrifolia]|uniref:protein PYRICULARIA ORYZAE RESISTANCE 21-like isoform X1 n=1 Tax=Macadamia integrifolia TaxID=60698 RepID=UPI001C4F9891|nr:protein PYRICULARIA ORYZAE RESISTANCE 21-like isoform X1 [Macadamia integrifolia]XP_042485149.1 protein PYRICULARIA ORYZAE RESISTANCE 21-like isoform X2 [Macadamia integrifolia]XP_042485150.1 protein PYRICULARIA ORYZAE RESISTANCE 21-like isoform X3 [Macadamia integrifolia]XP_042485151.1 protein PYRICULARIA ORYZAE RESISTANCE 21-like isoform X3 [Macadamia integrifolia]
MAHKVSTIVLKVDLACTRCNDKIRKVLCKYRERYQIQEEIYDEKNNTVTISGPFCPRKLAKKLCCKAGNAIKCINIVEKKPPPPPPPPPPPLGPPPPPPRRPPTRPPSLPSPRPTPVVVVEVVVEVPPPQSNSAPPRRSLKSAPPAPYEYGEGPCGQSYGGAPQPWYDGCGRSPPQWYSGYGSPSYFSEEDPNSCIIM